MLLDQRPNTERTLPELGGGLSIAEMLAAQNEWKLLAIPTGELALYGAQIEVQGVAGPAAAPGDGRAPRQAPFEEAFIFVLPERRVARITQTEKDIAIDRAQDMSNATSGKHRYRTESTQKTHVSHLLSKLSANNTAEAITKLIVLGELVIPPEPLHMPLTDRQLQVAVHIACGRENKDIAARLPYAIKGHVNGAFDAAGVHGREALVRYCFATGMFLRGRLRPSQTQREPSN